MNWAVSLASYLLKPFAQLVQCSPFHNLFLPTDTSGFCGSLEPQIFEFDLYLNSRASRKPLSLVAPFIYNRMYTTTWIWYLSIGGGLKMQSKFLFQYGLRVKKCIQWAVDNWVWNRRFWKVGKVLEVRRDLMNQLNCLISRPACFLNTSLRRVLTMFLRQWGSGSSPSKFCAWLLFIGIYHLSAAKVLRNGVQSKSINGSLIHISPLVRLLLLS